MSYLEQGVNKRQKGEWWKSGYYYQVLFLKLLSKNMLLMVLKHGNECSAFKPFFSHVPRPPPSILCPPKTHRGSEICDYSSVANAFFDTIPTIQS